MENTSDRVKIMGKPVPDFAIFQNGRTRVSGVWIKFEGKWRECPERDFDALEAIATMLRESPTTADTRKRGATVIAGIHRGFDL